jgi:hypothetical protein
MKTTMKTLLATAAVVAALTSPALAVPVTPTEMHGHWCVDASTFKNGLDASTLIYHKRTGRRCPVEDGDDDNSVKISAQSLDWSGFTCRVTAVDNFKLLVDLKCRSRMKFDGAYKEWDEQYHFSFVGKKLFLNPKEKP